MAERHSRHELADVQCTLRRAGDGYVLDGEKALVLNGAAADQLVVVARSGGSRFDAQGISLVLVDANAAGRHAHAAAADGRPARGPHPLRRGGGAGEPTAVRRRRAAMRCCSQVVQRRDAGAVRRSLRRDAAAARDHAGLREDAQAVRRDHRQLPGAAAPAGGHVHGAGTDALAAVPRGVLGRQKPAREAERDLRGAEGHGRQGAAG